MARGSIRQRSKVRKDSWEVQVYLGKDPETGRKRYHSETVKGSWSQAQRRLTEVLREMDTGTFVEPSRLSFGEYMEQWLRDYAETHVRQRTFEGYRGYVRRYIIPKLGDIPLDKLTPRHIQGMESEMLRDGGSRVGALSPRTVLQTHRILSSALRNAVKLGILTRNVAEAVDPPRITRYEAQTLTWSEVHPLLGLVKDSLFRTVVLLAVQTGLRRSELLGLQWRDVDLVAGSLSVQRAWMKLPSGGTELTALKSGGARVVNLPEESLRVLKALRGDLMGNGSFMFCHSDGRPLDPDMVTQSFKRLARKAGFEHFRFHDLRHTHASLMLGEGVHLKVVSERLGHSSIAITADIYSHVQPTVQKEAVERFGAAWSAGMANGMANGGLEG